jgi:thermosome
MASVQTTAGGMPVLILREGTKENKGKEAQRNNITAAKLIAEVVKTCLGPRGMDKMLVDTVGDVTITNDGATILKEIDVQHPAAKMMVEVAKSVDNEVGDGTTSSVVLAGALIEKAEELINKEVHPSVIVDGYTAAAEQALKILQRMAVKVDVDDKETLLKIAKTSMNSKLVSDDSPVLSQIVVNATKQVAEKTEGGDLKVDLDNIKVEKKAGGSIHDTKLIKGIVLDKEVVHAGMPKRIEGARIALLNSALEIEKTEMSAEIRINDPQQMQMFLEEENKMLKSMVDKIRSSGSNVVLCQKGIDDIAQHYLAKAEVLAVRRVKESDMFKLSKATGARIVSNLDDLVDKDLGSADLVEERKVETDKWVFIEGCKNPKAVTILVRGGSQRVVDEADRSVHDALMVVKDVLEKPAIVAGGGAPEAYISNELRQWSNNLEGRAQLAVHKFAEALDSIPLALAENAGMDPIDTMTDLRAKQGKRGKWIGVDVRNTVVTDMFKENVLEPLVVKEQIIKSATEAACMILRVDDVIS